MSDTVKRALDRLRERVVNPERRQLLADIAADATLVSSNALIGATDYELEMRHIAAQLANLTEEERLHASHILLEEITGTVRHVVLGAFGLLTP